MHISIKLRYISFYASFLSHFILLNSQQTPKLTVIIVVDQCAYHYFPRLEAHFKYGFKTLLDNGLIFTNAFMPHGVPSTAPGHAALSTGTFPKDHGFIANDLIDASGNKVVCDNDTTENALVINPLTNQTYTFGRSAANLMVDGISDNFARTCKPTEPHHVYIISYKSRSAIAAAGKLGTALWFDGQTGMFTTSKAYAQKIPHWVATFNKEHPIPSSFQWQLAYPSTSSAYKCVADNFYTVTKQPTLINKQIYINEHAEKHKLYGIYESFLQNPQANKHIFELAQECVNTHINKNKPDRLLLWVCASSLDVLGHSYGPDSYETIDMLYHLDKQLGHFISYLHNKIGKDQVLFVLSADHGVCPIIEQLHAKGYNTAHRVNPQQIIETANNTIKQRYNIENLVLGYQSASLYLDMHKFNDLKSEVQNNILQGLKKCITDISGIKQVWTYDELQKKCYLPSQLEYHYQQQLYQGRSGQIIIQPFPFIQITTNKSGTDHSSPYDYDTHIPIILYQEGVIPHGIMQQKVLSLQLARTVAELLRIPCPSASTFDILPGVFNR